MKLLLSISIAIFIFNSGTTLNAQSVGFDGSWKIDTVKSDFGGLATDIAAPARIQVIITSDSIFVKRTFRNQDPKLEVLSWDGKEAETLPDGNTLKKASVRLYNDQKIGFNWYYEINGNEWHYKRAETWSLSDDAHNLIIQRTTEMPAKTDRVEAVYNKLE